MSDLEKKLQLIEDRMKERLSSDKDAKLLRTLMETLIDIREAFEEFNRFFKIDINLEELEAFQVGAFDFLRKPTDANQLTCRINAAVRGKLGKNHICERSDATRMESRGSLS